MRTRPTNIAGYGWVPDVPDKRDFHFTYRRKPLPPAFDLRAKCPSVYDQGELGSCTANAIAGAVEFNMLKQTQKDVFTPSRLFIYYNERVIEHSVNSDSGAMIRDGMKTLNKEGAPHEQLWPYIISKFRIKPISGVYKDALNHQSIEYARVPQTVNAMKSCIASGYPFIFGFTVYESFESDTVASTGVVPMPQRNEQVLGGHAVVAVGYDDKTERFIVRNSWGSQWGEKGYFTMPYKYLSDDNLADDLWTVRLME